MENPQVDTFGEHETNLPADLAKPAQRALHAAGYTHLEQLTKVSEAELKQLHGIGPKAIEQLRKAMAANSLSFASAEGRKTQ